MLHLQELLQDSFEDHFLSRKERRELRSSFIAAKLNEHDAYWINSEIIKIAKAGPDPQLSMDWIASAEKCLIKALALKDEGESNEVFFSPGDECLNAIISAIDASDKAIDVCVFTISDDRITNALIRAHKRKCRLRIISDNDKMNDMK